MLRVYVAHAMTGRPGCELIKESNLIAKVLRQHNIEPLDPVTVEKISKTRKKTDASKHQMVFYWPRDKQMIREAHALIDVTPLAKSEGVAHEIGYARYLLWKPVVRVYPPDYNLSRGSVAALEDDLIAHSLHEAAIMINRHWGTWLKRFRWRVALYNRCWLRATWHKIQEWK